MSAVSASDTLGEFIRERRVANGSGIPIAFLLTPIGASAPFYCLPSSWSTYPIPDYGPLTASGIVSRLYRTMMSFNMALISSLRASQPNDRSLARASVSVTGCTEWYHGIMQAMLFDRVDWAVRSSGATGPILRNEQTPYTKPTALPKQAERMWEIYRNWPETASLFVTAWVASESEDIEMEYPYVTNENDGQKAIGPAGNDGEGAIGLVEDDNAKSTTGSGTESTGRLLAISLRALDEMKHVTRAISDGAMPKKRLTEYLADNYGHLPKEIAGLADYDLLRPLYALAGISPIVLLSKLQITVTGKCKVGLSHLAESITHPSLNDDRSRRYIESDLIRVVVTMALKGRSHFKTCMGPVIQRWREYGVITESNTVAPEKPVTEIDLAGSFRRAQETQPAGFRMIQSLTKMLEKIGRRSKAKSHELIDIAQVINLSGEIPSWLASALVSESSKKTSPLSGKDTDTETSEDDETRRSKREKKGVERGLGGELGKLSLKRNRKRNKQPEFSEDEYIDKSQPLLKEGGAKERLAGKGNNKRGAEDDIELNDKTSRVKKSRRIDDSDDSDDSIGNIFSADYVAPTFQFEYVDFSKPPRGTSRTCTFHLLYPLESSEDIVMSAAGDERSSIAPEASPSDPEHKEMERREDIVTSAAGDERSSIAPEASPSDPEHKEMERREDIVTSAAGDERSSIAPEASPSDPEHKEMERREDIVTSAAGDERSSIAPEASPSDPEHKEMERREDIVTSAAGDERSSIAPEVPRSDLVYNTIAKDDDGFGSPLTPLVSSPDPPNTEACVLSKKSVQREKSPCDPGYLDWETIKYEYSFDKLTIPVWPSLWDGFAERLRLLKASKGKQPSSCTITLLRKDWDRLDLAQRRAAFKRSNVHISGPPQTQTPLFGIKDWSSPNFDGLLNLSHPRQVHDLTVPIVDDENANLRKTTLGKMINYITAMKKEERLAPMKNAKSKMGAQCLNALDIPLCGTLPGVNFDVELDDCSKFAFQTDDAFKWRTKLGLNSLGNRWGLLALQSARSGVHMDAGGGCTMVRMVLGSKEWLIATDPDMIPGPRGWHPEDSDWESVYLRPGDDLLMRPGTVHSVITLDDCFAVGGHFYHSGLFIETLNAMIIEHYRGKWVTNTEHTRMPMLLLKALTGYAEILRDQSEYQLGPELPEGANESSWTDSLQFKSDFIHALIVLHDCNRIMTERFSLTFQKELANAEENFSTLVAALNDSLDETEMDKLVTCICICGLSHKQAGRFKMAPKTRKASNDENGATNKASEKRVPATRSSTQSARKDPSPYVRTSMDKHGEDDEDDNANTGVKSKGKTVAAKEKPKNVKQTKTQPKPRPIFAADDVSTETTRGSLSMKRPTLNGKEAAIKNKRTASDSPLNSVPANDNMGGRSPLETDGMTQMGEDADEYVTVLSNDLAASDGAYKFVSDNDSELGSASDKNTGDEDGDGGHHDSESDAAEEKAKSKGKGRRIFESSDFLSGSDEENEDIGDAMDLDLQAARSAQGKDVLEKHREKMKSEGHARKQDKGLEAFVACKESTVFQTKGTRKESNGQQAQSGQAACPEVRKVQAASERQGKRAVEPSADTDSDSDGQQQPLIKKRRKRRTIIRNVEDEERQKGDDTLGYYKGSIRLALKLYCFTSKAFISPRETKEDSRLCFGLACHEVYGGNKRDHPPFSTAFEALLAKEPWVTRGKLKAAAKVVIKEEYDIAPPALNGPEYADLSAKRREKMRVTAVRSKVEALIGTETNPTNIYAFANKNGRGEDTMPFSHPAIKELIFRFAFNSAGKADPLVYARQDWLNPIPKKTIALATLALHNSLNEFATGRHVEVAFDEKTYSSAYVDMVAQLRRLSQSQNKRDMLADWQRNVYAEGMERCDSHPSCKEFAAIYVPSSDIELDEHDN
ncbi:hypothetical protein DFH11DRAFT_1813003 [Phellopilus nigrolimitatus]|nr:hypothetical protein DFH11DRAFT_1813003 [Phellopilus nigrolimitatus]